MSFDRPTLSTLIGRAQDDINARLPGADSRLRRSVLDVLARTHAGAMNGAYGYLDDIARFLPDVADTDRLERWASIFGLTRTSAVAASGPVNLVGIDTTPIPAGTVLIRADGVRYLTADAAEIDGAGATVAIAADAAGTGTSMATGQLLTFLSPIPGVSATATVAAPGIGGGADEETDDALRIRLLERIRSAPAGGNGGDYLRWAKEIAGVTRAWVYPNANGLGTVQLLFVMDGRDDIIPTDDDVDAVAAHIDPLRPVTADVTVAAPIADAIAVSLHVVPDTTAVRAAVLAELQDLFAREAEPGGTVLLSHINEAIAIAAGETDHVLATPAADVVSAPGHIAVLGAVSWT